MILRSGSIDSALGRNGNCRRPRFLSSPSLNSTTSDDQVACLPLSTQLPSLADQTDASARGPAAAGRIAVIRLRRINPLRRSPSSSVPPATLRRWAAAQHARTTLRGSGGRQRIFSFIGQFSLAAHPAVGTAAIDIRAPAAASASAARFVPSVRTKSGRRRRPKA